MPADEANSERPLDRALQAGPLTPAAGAALADDILAELEKLHGAGTAHGFVRAPSVHLRADGTAALQATPAPAEPSERPADVRATAALVCEALAIPLRWSPTDPLRESERAAPALAATLRALAQGSLNVDAAGARAALHEAAGGLGDEEAVNAGRAELRALSGATVPPPAVHHAPTITVPPPLNERPRRPFLIAAGVAAAVVILAGLGVLGWSTAGRHAAENTAKRSSPAPLPQQSASPLPLPSIPTASGPIKSVSETPLSTCNPGSSCKVEVDVHFVEAESPEDVSWQFELVDSCTSDATYVEGSTVHAKKGWVHVVGDTELTLPAGHPLTVIAVTTEPSHAVSAPLLITAGTC